MEIHSNNPNKLNSYINQNNSIHKEKILTIPFKTKKQYKREDFEFISNAGQGAYAKVYKVKDLTIKEQPIKAIKVMEINTMKQLHKLYHIYLENEVLNNLEHPNIVSIEGIFEDQGKIFIILEYLNKGDFSDLLTLNYPLKEETIQFYVAEIVNVLEYLKKNKIVHRDLKPENMMLDSNYHLKVIDFATARILGKYFDEGTMTFVDDGFIDNNQKAKNKDLSSKTDNNNDPECGKEKTSSDNSMDIEIEPIEAKEEPKDIIEQNNTQQDESKKEEEKKTEKMEGRINSSPDDPLKFKNSPDFSDDDEDFYSNNNTNTAAKEKFRDDVDEEKEIINRQKRGITFVGTAEYVSPEVLKDIPADCGADIWALGCILYLMFYGQTPFKEKTEYLIFQKIKQNTLTFPEKEIPVDAKDLISKLLEFDPKKRLGNGEDGTENDFEHLKNHPFFKGINFDKLPEMDVPNYETFRLKPKLASIKAHKDESKTVPKKEIERKIEILKKGILSKKSPLLHYNTREIIVDSTPKLEYIDPNTKQIKGSVYLTKKCSAEPCDDVVFYLNTPKRVFKFKSSEKEAFVWVKTINDAIKKYA